MEQIPDYFVARCMQDPTLVIDHSDVNLLAVEKPLLLAMVSNPILVSILEKNHINAPKKLVAKRLRLRETFKNMSGRTQVCTDRFPSFVMPVFSFCTLDGLNYSNYVMFH